MLNSDTQEYIPQILSFTDANGNDTTKEQVEANYRQIKLDVVEIIEREKERIANDPWAKAFGGEGGGKITYINSIIFLLFETHQS